MSGLIPDIHCASVLDVDPQALAESGVRGVLLDLDNTLLARGSSKLAPEVIAWVSSLRENDLKVAIVSNTNNDRCARIAGELGVPLVRNAFKPFKRGLVRACAMLGIACKDAVMIGDQCYTDILGANCTGMISIMVDALSDADPVHTKFLRVFDRFAIRRSRALGRSID